MTTIMGLRIKQEFSHLAMIIGLQAYVEKSLSFFRHKINRIVLEACLKERRKEKKKERKKESKKEKSNR